MELGRLLGAQVLVFGSVSRFEMSSGAGVSFGGFSLSGTTGRAALTGRIVDATTGVILGSVEGTGEATGASFSVRNFEGISFQASEFQDSALGRAVTRAVDDFTDQMSRIIEANKDRVLAAKARSELQGVVVAVIPNGIVVNIGEQHGVRRENLLEVYRRWRCPDWPIPCAFRWAKRGSSAWTRARRWPCWKRWCPPWKSATLFR